MIYAIVRLLALKRQQPYQTATVSSRMTKIDLTQTRLKQLMHYDPLTGAFTWLRRPELTGKGNTWNIKNAGNTVGAFTANGYLQTSIQRVKYTLHRLAFLYMEGCFPPLLVDHRNRVRHDNRWRNLRHSDYILNAQNSGPRGPKPRT